MAHTNECVISHASMVWECLLKEQLPVKWRHTAPHHFLSPSLWGVLFDTQKRRKNLCSFALPHMALRIQICQPGNGCATAGQLRRRGREPVVFLSLLGCVAFSLSQSNFLAVGCLSFVLSQILSACAFLGACGFQNFWCWFVLFFRSMRWGKHHPWDGRLTKFKFCQL